LYSYCVLLFFCVRNWLMLLKIYIMLKFDIWKLGLSLMENLYWYIKRQIWTIYQLWQ
jgi:hypothetical protein